MLITLMVQNFAIIDNLTIDFKNGLTIITGETGAGKSLIIDAIGLLLGERSSTTMIRSGFSKATVEGVFNHYSPKVAELLDLFGIEQNLEKELIIKKEIYATGKSTSRINGSFVTINQLSQITELLADIHTQEDTKKLFDTHSYLDFIESPSSKILLEAYSNAYLAYQHSLNSYEKLKQKARDVHDEIDFMRFRRDELLKADLKLMEENEIEEELQTLNNFENIYLNLTSIKERFEANNIIDTLYDTNQKLEQLTKFSLQYEGKFKKIEDIYYELEDFISDINSSISRLEFDENRLNQLNERSNFLHDLKRRYRKSIPELITYLNELDEQLIQIDQYDDLLIECHQKLKKDYEALVEVAMLLTFERKKNAKVLQESIKVTLTELHLSKVQIEIVFEKNNFKNEFYATIFKVNGVDEVNILVSFNPGEPLKELSKIASGGEMSRVMLALKTHLLTNMELSTMIFDEIDQGVSGVVAEAIANKLKMISQNTQVLAISHLPIVASAADYHLHIMKKIVNERTITCFEELSFSKRLQEIAKMIAPSSDNKNVQDLALSMIKKWQ